MIRWSKLASVQFKVIHDYIAKDSLRAAHKQASVIMNASINSKDFLDQADQEPRPKNENFQFPVLLTFCITA